MKNFERTHILIKYLIIFFLVTFQLSFFKGLGWPWFNINLLLGIAFFWIIYEGLEKNLAPIIVGAVIIDLFNSSIFGIITVAVFFTCYLLYLIFLHLFTNRSLLSLLSLGVIGILIYNFFLAIFSYFFFWLNLSDYYNFLDKEYWHNLSWQVIFILLCLAIFYWSVGSTKKEFI